MKTSLVLVLVAFLLSACSTLALEGRREPVLFNPVIDARSLAVSVPSYGCTSPNDFYLVVTGDVIELRRTRLDRCAEEAELIRIEFDDNFGYEAYRFKNKVRYANRVGR